MAHELLLEFKDIHVHFGGVKALNGVSMYLDEGEIIAIMGANGAGKSTILKTIFGLTDIESGSILWHGKELVPVSYEMAERGIAFVPQGRRVFAHLSIEENLEIGAWMVRNREEVKRRLEEVYLIFPVLKTKRKQKATALSGGQQQMLAIGRGLMADPKVLLLDEPSLGLSPKVVKEVFEKIKEINERHKTAMLIVEHNIKSLLAVADRAYILDKGKIIISDSADKVSHTHLVEHVLLGM